MKKFVLILGLFLFQCANAWADDTYQIKNDIAPNINNVQVQKTNSAKEQEFVNPIFNKTLLAYSKQTWNTLLSPNSISESPDNFSDPDAHIEKHNCKLLVNKQDYIKFLCNVCYQDILIANKINCSIENILYKITDDGLIEKQSFRLQEPEPYSREFFITKP